LIVALTKAVLSPFPRVKSTVEAAPNVPNFALVTAVAAIPVDAVLAFTKAAVSAAVASSLIAMVAEPI